MTKHVKKNSKFSIAISAILTMTIGVVIPQAAVAATSVGPTTTRVVVSPSSSTTLNTALGTSNAISISGFGSSPSTDLVRVEVTETGGGQIQLASTTGLTAVTGLTLNTSAQDSIGFTGSVDSANAALAGMKYVSGATLGSTASVDIVVSYAGTGSDLYAFYGTNEHFYKYVSTAVTWTAAKTAAEAATFNGLRGYLATSTSAGENAFITSRVGTADSWLGGADGGTTGGTDLQWRWVGGPESGKRFFNQNSISISGAPNGSNYTSDELSYSNFANGEPNGTSSWDENALQIVAGGTGKWNDLKENDSGTTIGYVIEFGGMAGDVISKASTSRKISVEVNYPEVAASTGNCVQNIANTTGVTVLDPNGDGSKCIVKFTSTAASTTWRAPTGVTAVESLIVAGGGGGGAWVGGGGGAGGVILKTGSSALTVTAGSTYTVTVGSGGAGAVISGSTPTVSNYAANGTDSVFSNQTAVGGGGGGSWAEPSPAANTGGSGGGGSGFSTNAGAAGTAGQGNAGGSGHPTLQTSSDNAHPAGGGGGAGAVGSDVSGSVAGRGGDGISTNISGTSTWYGGGGGGSVHGSNSTWNNGTAASGGQGGGGAGAGPNRTNYGVVMTTAVTGQAGTANTGGGGGGAGAPSTGTYSSTGGAGGSGVVILSYSGTGNPTITTHPSDTSKIPAQTATFSVVATSPDSGTLSYQWQVFSTAITASWTDISGATSATYTTGAVAIGNDGYKYRVNVTNTIGSSGKTVTSNVATLSVSNIAVVDVAWNELNYDYTAGKYVNQVGTGKLVGDKVLFKNVITRNGTCVDSLVTTKTLSSGTVKFYESGTGAGGAKTNFEVDIDFAANNGYGEFQFDFFVCGTYDQTGGRSEATALAGATRVELRNLAITLIDIDYYQWNEATGMDSFTIASNTKLKYGPAGTPLATGTTIGTTNGAIASYPANVRFQGPSAIDSTIPEDQAIINYGSIQTFNVKMGRSASGSPNYFGIAFKSLSWGSTTPATQGPATTYTIAYEGNGATSGAVPSSHTGKVGANFTVATNSGTLVKAGYTFGGWNTASDGSGTTYSAAGSIMMPKDGLTLYAIWTPSVLTLTYSANGGSGAPANESRVAGSVSNLSTGTPTRAGYNFTGWTKAQDGTGSVYSTGTSLSFTMPGAATTVYAQWQAATGTIAYNGNGSSSGSTPSSSTGTSGSTYTVIGNTGSLARTGFTFAGWNTAANGSGTDYAAGNSTSYPASGTTVTLYAQWTAIVYSLSYNANGGNNAAAGAAPTQTGVSGATLTLASTTYNPVRTGYTFDGWYTTASGTGGTLYAAGLTTYSMPATNTILYAKWTAVLYNVYYDKNSSSATGTLTDTTYANNATVTVKHISAGSITSSTLRFVGWNTAADGTGSDYISGSTFRMGTANVTLYAKWVAANIVLTFDANGGTNAPPADTHAAATAITLPTQTPSRPGYEFLGWTESSNGSGTVYDPSGPYTTPPVNGVLYAKWRAFSYTFFYNANGGVAGVGAPVSVTGLNVGGLVTVYVVDGSNPAPTRAGYSFTGWNAAANGVSTNYAGGSTYTMGTSDYTIYAQWLGDPFTLTYNSNGGAAVSPTSEVRRAGSVSSITATVPTRTGYTFSSWNTASNGSGTTYASSASLTMPADNVMLYAQWTAVNSGVSYNANGGSGAPSGANYNFGAQVTVSSGTPTRTGYTFTGWNTQQGGGGTPYSGSDTFNMPSGSVVLYAQWTATAYVFDYDANGGINAPIATNQNFSDTVTVTTTRPTRAGYDFQGWNTVVGGSGTTRTGNSSFTMPANNVTLYAQWSLATFTVYYNANGGTGSITPQPARFGTTVTLSSSIPARSGYRFDGWNTAPDGSGVDYARSGTLTMPDNNVTLYAKWVALTYTLTYVANGGINPPAAVTGKTTGENFALATSAQVPTRSTYWFSGWNTAADGSGTNFASSANFVMGSSDVTLYAKWVENSYTVSYNANGGAGAPASQATASTVEVERSTATIQRPGYTFSHWYTTPSGTGGTQYAPGSTLTPSGNVVLYAIWTPKTIRVTYDINGGANPSTDTPPYQDATYDGQPIQLAGSGGFAKADSRFLTWNTVADGTGTSYAAEDPNFRVPSSNVTLYAIWSAAYYAVEYNPNGGTGAPNDQFAAPGQTVVVAPSEPQKTGYEFVAWSDVSTGTTYSANAAITMPSSNVTLVANWTVRSASVPGGSSESKPGTPITGITYPKKLNLTVYFKGDRSYLIPATVTKLKKLAATAKLYGYATNITIYGRVKETNDKSYDAKLSKARAINVAKYLKKLGVQGAFKIIPAGISPENKAISRRVDMSLFWNKR